jgi:hypothetical protein
MTSTATTATAADTKVITGPDDIAFADTPVTFCRYTETGPVERVEHQQRASLFEAQSPPARRRATLVTRDIDGDPFVKTGRLDWVTVVPRAACGRSPWQLRIGIVPPRMRNPLGFERDFPADPLLLLWDIHNISLADLPPLTAEMRWHCKNFAATWQEVSRRCHATGSVWLDTTAAAIESQGQRRTNSA